jgi:Mrp family chromosome partitioning ATPase
MALDLSREMADLAASLGPLAQPAGVERGRVIQFAAARSREGVSTVAREFARFMADKARRPVWLVDADLDGSVQYSFLLGQQTRFGALGAATAASPDGSIFFRVTPPLIEANGAPMPDARYLVAHPLGGARLWVTRFRRKRLKPHQTVSVLSAPAYWNALRGHADLIVIDAPAAERGQTSVTLAPFADATVLVAAANEYELQPPAILRGALQAAGGRVAGLFYNKVEITPPPFLKSVMP